MFKKLVVGALATGISLIVSAFGTPFNNRMQVLAMLHSKFIEDSVLVQKC
ncbi:MULTISPECIES: hypothetical protein [Bacillus]|uniref:Uncharacterized protein n=1 Tax=Bacillus cereus HuB4-4 TaxID=1053211 RepID=A0A9W5QYB6_BACCE|nr:MULTISPECIES: hypothetical protein [Bacillus cereus group]EOP95526.1 hypothetical protein IGM_00987 [Bacillus cereus HuB4-4]MCU4983097.1 hypothetical protein [Bacillus cereus]MCU5346944.1 hypothetical protein [Bacillus cereus]HDR3896821.1 hypothetical protein [Bacillus cereus]HDR4873771.1 hypothetical protein [Bacillus cereus]